MSEDPASFLSCLIYFVCECANVRVDSIGRRHVCMYNTCQHWSNSSTEPARVQHPKRHQNRDRLSVTSTYNTNVSLPGCHYHLALTVCRIIPLVASDVFILRHVDQDPTDYSRRGTIAQTQLGGGQRTEIPW